MKLLLVTNLFPTPHDTERGVFTYQLVKRLQKLCSVTVVCPLPWFPSFSIFGKIRKYQEFSTVPKEYVYDGIKVFSPKYPLIPRVSENLHAELMSWGIRGCITKLHREKNFDAVNSQWLYPDSVAVGDVIGTLGIPHIATGLGCDVNEYLNNDSKSDQILKTLRNAKEITVVSNSLKAELEQHQIEANKISVIPNGVDIDQFKLLDKSESRAELGLEAQPPLFLYVGRLSEEKSVDTLIHATSRVIETGTEIRLVLVGDGPERGNLQSLVDRLKINDRVQFKGKVEHSKVGLWMGAADYFCLPSLREGCPNVILEALGCGRPVIASHVGAIPDVVSSESGILFTPRNVEELSKAMITAMKNSWNHESIHDSILELSWERAAEKYHAVFVSAMDGSRAGG